MGILRCCCPTLSVISIKFHLDKFSQGFGIIESISLFHARLVHIFFDYIRMCGSKALLCSAEGKVTDAESF